MASAVSPAQIREILTIVAMEYDTDIHGVTSMSGFSLAHLPKLAAFDHTCVPVALEMLLEFRDKSSQFEATAGFIVAAWAAHDLAAARAGLDDPRLLRSDGKISGLAVRTLMEEWSVNEPVAALQWALGMVDSGRTALDPAIGIGRGLFKHWAQSDPQAALDELSRRAATQPKLVADGMWGMMWDKDAKSVFLDRLGPVEREQALSLGRLALRWAPPEFGKQMLDRLSLPPATREELLKDL